MYYYKIEEIFDEGQYVAALKIQVWILEDFQVSMEHEPHWYLKDFPVPSPNDLGWVDAPLEPSVPFPSPSALLVEGTPSTLGNGIATSPRIPRMWSRR